jgi:hypothetical protein
METASSKISTLDKDVNVTLAHTLALGGSEVTENPKNYSSANETCNIVANDKGPQLD